MPCRLLKPYNGQAANTVFWGSQADEAPLLASGNADDRLELATDFVDGERTFTGAGVNTSRYATRYRMSSATAQTLTVNASGYWPVGQFLTIVQMGAGKITIGGATGVTILSGTGFVTQGQYSVAQLLKLDATTWVAFGQLGAT